MAGQGEYHMTFYARVTSYSNRGSDQDLDVVTTHLRELTRHPLSGLARAYQAISGQEISRFVHARPSIITLTALHPSQGPSTCASASQRRLSSPLFLLCLQPSISSALNNNWYCRLEGGFVRTQRTPPGSAPDCYYDGCARPMIQ